MYARVLVPVDGSELAECSFGEVKKAIGPTSEVILLQVAIQLSDTGSVYAADQLLRDAQAKAMQELQEYLDVAVARLRKDGVNARGELVAGRPTEEIIAAAGRLKADLIVISTHGRSGASRWAFGSVADKVLRAVRIPVLMSTPAGCRMRE